MAAIRRSQTTPPGTWIINGTAVPLSRLPHDNLGPQLNFTIWLLAGLSAGFLALRIYCKFLRNRGLWWDDHILILSWLSLAATCAFISVSVSFGFGKYDWDIATQGSFRDLKYFGNWAGMFSILAAMWSKSSFALTLYRISQPWMRKVIWFVIITLNLFMGASALFQWIHCAPIARTYDSKAGGTCWPQHVLDGSVFWHPRYLTVFFPLEDCHEPAHDQVGEVWGGVCHEHGRLVSGVSLMGLVFPRLTCCPSAGMASFIKYRKVSSIGGLPVDTVALVSWGAAESAITIIAASIPILRALIREPPPPAADFRTADRKILVRPAAAEAEPVAALESFVENLR